MKNVLWYLTGLFIATIFAPFILAATDPRPVFASEEEAKLDFWAKFWNSFPEQLGASLITFLLLAVVTTPLFFLFLRICSQTSHVVTTWLGGIINFSLLVYVMAIAGNCVRNPSPSSLDYYLNSYWVFTTPLITTALAVLPSFILSRHPRLNRTPPSN